MASAWLDSDDFGAALFRPSSSTCTKQTIDKRHVAGGGQSTMERTLRARFGAIDPREVQEVISTKQPSLKCRKKAKYHARDVKVEPDEHNTCTISVPARSIKRVIKTICVENESSHSVCDIRRTCAMFSYRSHSNALSLSKL